MPKPVHNKATIAGDRTKAGNATTAGNGTAIGDGTKAGSATSEQQLQHGGVRARRAAAMQCHCAAANKGGGGRTVGSAPLSRRH